MNMVSNMQSVMNPQQRMVNQATPAEAHQSFKTWLNDAIANVNESRIDSEVMTERLARGEQVDLHDVMITAQKASIMLETTVEVRNKVIEAYQEVMRMSV
ncbi:flagellar hook-basal body complex protein FliE [Paenalkalicoccus suaedae]|nr:flagellar hook-basal body complex protein FliE [Paenalkalicoccus suaedae]